HGPQAGHRGAEGGTDDGGLADRRVTHARGPEPFPQLRGGPEGPARRADVLPHDDDGRVALHLLGQRPVDRLPVLERRHAYRPPSASGAYTSSVMLSAGAGSRASAHAAASSTPARTRASMSSMTVGSRMPAAATASRNRRMGSRSRHRSTSSGGRYFCGSPS